MDEEKQGAEREFEAKVIAAQQKADLDHLLKNVHPSLRDMVSLGDTSNGTTQTLSDYSAQIFTAQINLLKEAVSGLRDSVVCLSSELAQLRSEHDMQINLLQQAHTDLKSEIESLRLKLIPSATPETPTEELNPHLGAMADEQPAPTPTVAAGNGVTVLQPAPTVAPVPVTEISAPKVQQ